MDSLKAVGAAIGMPMKLTHTSYKQALATTSSSSTDKPSPAIGSNTDGERDGHPDGELSKNGNRSPRRNHDGEASEDPNLSLAQKYRILQHQLQMAEAERDAYKAELSKIDKVLRKDGSNNATGEADMMALAKVLSLKRQHVSLDRELKKTQGMLDSSTVDLRKAQLTSFKQAQTGWPVEEDSAIHDALTRLYRDVRLWAKTYGVKTLDAFRAFSTKDNKYIHKSVSKVALFRSYDEFLGFKHPFLILAALVSNVLTNRIFADYFYIFRNPGHPDDLTANVLEDIFCRLCNGNPADAHMWRALLLRAVFPKTESSDFNTWTEFVSDHCAVILDWFMGEIIQGPASAFLRHMERDEHQTCKLQLQDLISRAMKLFSRLQTQRADYVWNEPSDSLCTSFDVHSPKMAADRLVRLDDDEDESCNGKKIKIVVSPAVQRYGNSHGENFQTGHFLVKAVVFLEV